MRIMLIEMVGQVGPRMEVRSPNGKGQYFRGIGQYSVTYRENVVLQCGWSVLAAEWLDWSTVGIAQVVAHAEGESILCVTATQLFPNYFGISC